MKYNNALVRRCTEWIKMNGLSFKGCPTVADFCEAMGFSDRAYYKWMDERAEFAQAIADAREYYRQHTVRKVFNALLDAALGGHHPKDKKIYEDRAGRPVQVKGLREDIYYPPNVDAAKFILKNYDPENWKDKQDSDITLDLDAEQPPVIVFGKEEPKEE
jgi:hypothetical protein